MSIEDNKLFQEYRESYLSEHERVWNYVQMNVSSAIEKLMLAHMLAEGFTFPHPLVYVPARKALESLGVHRVPGQFTLAARHESFSVTIQPRIDFGTFRITPDFGLLDHDVATGQPPIAVAVELDGHAFHERTKEQAGRDKKRDRSLLSKGWSVIRFTGSEVMKDPAAVYAAWSETMAAERKKRGNR